MATRTTLLLVALALAGGCSSAMYHRLPCEAEMPDHCHMAKVNAELPNSGGFVTVGEAAGEPVRVWYRHTRGGSSGWLVVMLPGVLADSSAMRFVAGGLGEKHDLLLVDYLGTGRSDKPDPDDLPADGYSPRALARQVLLVIRECARDEHVAVVGHSLGSLTILRMLGCPGLREEFPEEIAKIERAVLLSPIDFAIARKHEAFEQVVELSDLEVTLGDQLGILRAALAESFCEGAGDPDRMPREAVDATVEILADPARLHAAQAMLRQAVPFKSDECLDWERIGKCVGQYRNLDIPCLLISGERDCTFTCAMGYKLQVQLPNAWLHVIPGCGHSPNLERPCEVARWIDWFIERGGESLPRVTDGIVAQHRLPD